MHKIARIIFTFGFFCAASAHASPPSVYLEDLTWPEVQNAMQAGYRTIIIPTGGTEQNGPHMVLGKHNYIVHYTAGEIAKALGNVLVAPVVTYVPEGRITPPEGHMRYPGTISVSETTFAHLLTDTAQSMKQHGFTLICMLGDSGDNQRTQTDVAEALSRQWKKDGVTVLQVSDYYFNNGQEEWLKQQGFTQKQISGHAGIEDTSELLAINSKGIRKNLCCGNAAQQTAESGVTGDSSHANAAIGEKLLQLKIASAVKQIKAVQNH